MRYSISIRDYTYFRNCPPREQNYGDVPDCLRNFAVAKNSLHHSGFASSRDLEVDELVGRCSQVENLRNFEVADFR